MKNIGIVGLGRMGGLHRKALQQLENRQIFVFDPLLSSSQEKIAGIEMVDSLESLADNVSAAIVSPPQNALAQSAAQLLKRGVHCLIEKPAALNSRDALLIFQAATAGQSNYQIGFVERHYPLAQYCMSVLKSDHSDIKLIRMLRHGAPKSGTYLARDLIEDLVVHDIDFFQRACLAINIPIDARVSFSSLFAGGVLYCYASMPPGCPDFLFESSFGKDAPKREVVFMRESSIQRFDLFRGVLSELKVEPLSSILALDFFQRTALFEKSIETRGCDPVLLQIASFVSRCQGNTMFEAEFLQEAVDIRMRILKSV